MAISQRSRTAVPTAVIWNSLRDALAQRSHPAGLSILDAGGGTGGFAVPLAELGHHVTVVDPSPDSLAALERRADEVGATNVVALQGDVAGLLDVVTPGAFDVVLCHNVLDVVDDPVDATTALVQVAREGGLVSVVVPTRGGAVLARAVGGHLGDAARVLDDPAGRWGAGDPLARRFDRAELLALLGDAGLTVTLVHGARVLTDLLPGALLDGDPATLAQLEALETRLAGREAFLDVAAALHVLAVKD